MAAVPDGIVLSPTLQPSDVVAQYYSFAAENQWTNGRQHLVCSELSPSLQLCYRVHKAGKVSYLTVADLDAIDLPQSKLADLVDKYTLDNLPNISCDANSIDGITRPYYMCSGLKEWIVSPALQAGWMAKVAGDEVVVATPELDTLLFWVAGDKELDKIMAVGALKMYNEASHPVTSTIHALNGEQWSVWGEAKMAE